MQRDSAGSNGDTNNRASRPELSWEGDSERGNRSR